MMAHCLCRGLASPSGSNGTNFSSSLEGLQRRKVFVSIGYGERKFWNETNCSSELGTSIEDPTLLVVEVNGGASSSSVDLQKLQWFVYEVILPFLIATGVVTNIIDLIVLSRPSMRGASFRYLARLALSDLLYLLFNIPFCFEDFSDVTSSHPVSKVSAVYYSHVAVPVVNIFLTMSIYIVVWLSYDRCIAVCIPHKFSAKQRLKVVKERCGVSLVLTILVYIPSPLRQTFDCSNGGCCVFDSETQFYRWFLVYELLREIYSRFIPAIAITGFNLAIIITLNKVKKARKGREQNADIINESRQERERRLVLLLLAITVFFYVSTLPSALYKIIHNHSSTFFPYFRAVADILEVSGHVFNFVLYFLFSPEFRKTLLSLHGNQNTIPMTSSIVQAE